MKRAVEVNEACFKNEVLRSSQPVIVDFWIKGCEACRQVASLLEEIAAEQAGQVKIATVNVEANPNLAACYHVKSTPTVLYFYNGLIRDQTLGVADKQTIVSKLAALPGAIPAG